jgi:hypothetical protein
MFPPETGCAAVERSLTSLFGNDNGDKIGVSLVAPSNQY